MLHARGFVAAAVALLIAIPVINAPGALVPGQIDDFENGTLQSWQNGGAANPNPATNVITGGPSGANDNFLRIASNGTGTAGGKLVVFNADQWAGDYLDAGVNAIQMHVSNPGPSALTLRLILMDFVHGQSLTTVAPVSVPAGSGWNAVSFSLAVENLTGGDYVTALASVAELNLLHSPLVIPGRSSAPNIVAELGIDNITAVVPEAGTLALAAAGCATMTCRRARNRAAP